MEVLEILQISEFKMDLFFAGAAISIVAYAAPFILSMGVRYVFRIMD